MRRLLVELLLVAATVASAPTSALAQRLSKAERAAVNATPEQISMMTEIRGDSLDTEVRISSQPFLETGRAGGDKFLRAYIDKKTGATDIQVYAWTTVRGDWAHFNRVNYESPNGPVSVSAIAIDGDASCSRYGCRLREDIAFEVPEATLRGISRGARAGTDDTWKFKIFGRSAEPVTTGLLKTEIAGFLISMDRVRAALKLPLHPGSVARSSLSPTPSELNGPAEATVPASGPQAVKAQTPSGFCLDVPDDYVGTGSRNKPAVTSAMPRCSTLRP